jgi:hypothetical protein
MAGQFGTTVGPHHRLVDLLRQFCGGKVSEGPREGGLVGNLAGAFPAAESPEGGPGAEFVEQGGGGGEAIDGLGDKRLEQPEAGDGRSAVARPGVAFESRVLRQESQDLDEQAVFVAEGAEFFLEGREELALEAGAQEGQVN